MRKRKYSTKAIVFTIIAFIAALCIGGVVRGFIPEAFAAWKPLVFWLVTFIIAGPSAILIAWKVKDDKGGKR